MKLFNKVAIIGTGLIGGSIALDIKKNKLAGEVVGVSRHKRNISLAKKMHAIDKGSQDIFIAKGADLVIFATPVETILSLAPRIAAIVDKNCIVTDVGSTKQKIASKLEKVFLKYAGSHPMAGSEKHGVRNAKAGMLKDSLCLVTRDENTNKEAVRKITKLWSALGTKVLILSPAAHDKILSFVSHLPHAVAFSLISSVPKEYFKFSSSGLKDATRIAASEPELWADIFLTNRGNMLKSITVLENNLAGIKSAINNKNKHLLTRILKKASEKRNILSL